MNQIKELMVKHPLVSMALLFPFSPLIIFAVFSILINIILPVLLALSLTNWIYNFVISKSLRNASNRSFSFIQSKYHSIFS